MIFLFHKQCENKVIKGMSGSGTSLKTKASLIKNKENQSFVTYKSLNQRIYDQNMQLSKNPINNMNT